MYAINWNIRQCFDQLVENQRLAILIILLSHCNLRLRCYPTIALLVKETGLSSATIASAKARLELWGAFIYVPYDKRVGAECNLPPNQKVYQLTGILVIGDQIYEYLYMTPEAREDVNILLSEILTTKILPSEILTTKIKVYIDSKDESNNQDKSTKEDSMGAAPAPKPLNAYQLFIKRYCEILQLDFDLTSEKIKSNTARLWKKGTGYTLDDLNSFADWWYKSDENTWRRNQIPQINNVNDDILKAKNWKQQQIQVKANGHIPKKIVRQEDYPS